MPRTDPGKTSNRRELRPGSFARTTDLQNAGRESSSQFDITFLEIMIFNYIDRNADQKICLALRLIWIPIEAIKPKTADRIGA